MDRFRTFIEEVRSRTDIVEIIGADVELRPSGSTLKALSPFHPEKKPSFVVWPATQTWHDFSNGGGLGGDVFAYLQERDKVGFKEVVYGLAAQAGIRAPHDGSVDLAQELARWEERREVERVLSLAAAYYHHVLPSKIRETWYRTQYGFHDETIDELLLGWADGHLYDHLTTRENVSREAALKTGLFVVLAGGRVEDFFRDRLVFPYWRGGRVVYFIARATEYTGNEEWEKSKYKKLLTHSERHDYISPAVRNDFLYNEDAARGADELLVTEGVTDCISAMQAGLACISPVTTRFRKQDVPRLLELTRRTRRIIICNDSEANGAGEAGAKETAAALWAEGREVCLAFIPRPEGKDKIDVNELVALQGPDALREVLAQAKPYPEYLLESIPQDAPKGDLDRLLEPVLASLTGCSSIRSDAVLDAVTEKFGVRRRALTRRMKELSSKKRVEAATQTPTDSLPEIHVGGRQLRHIVTDARAAVTQANERRIQIASVARFENDAAPLFVRGSSLVQLERPTKGPPMLSDLTENGIYGVLLREGEWIHETEEGKHAVYPPREVSRDLLTYPPPGIPAVESVLTTPVFGQDGQLLVSPGLHASDRIWLEADASLNIGEVPENPTPEQIAAARSLFFDDLFVDFPFTTESDRAHALAAVLLPFMRRMLEGCTPMHVVEAPAVGAGKGLLCNLVSIVVTGESCDSRTLPESDEEIRKMLTAELSKARPIILLDNANEKQTLAASSLTSVLTTLSWTDRILGRTQMLTVPNTAMWMLTGNNPRLSPDIARRSIRIRIDPKVDRAWTRASFKHDPIVPWAKAHRSELVYAALVLVRAWLAAGRPLSARARLGSFEDWAPVMGGVLEVAGVQGFLGNLDELYANADIEGEAWREFTLAWWDEYGQTATNVSSLTELCEKHDLMLQARGDGSARSQQSRLGRALQGARDRVFGDLQMVIVNHDRKKRTLYALKRLEEKPAPPPPAVIEPVDGDPDEIDPWQ